jgi:hypothetical protein
MQYNTNRKNATATELEDSAVGSAILLAVSQVRRWAGTPAALYEALTAIVGKKVTASARWPKSTRAFSNELRRITPQLRLNGLAVDFERGNNGRRIIMTNRQGISHRRPDAKCLVCYSSDMRNCNLRRQLRLANWFRLFQRHAQFQARH